MRIVIPLLLTLIQSILNAQPPVKSISSYGGAIVVSNLDTSFLWYQKIFNLDETTRTVDPNGQYRTSISQSDNMLIELLELSGSISPKSVLEDKAAGTQMKGHFKLFFKVSNISEILHRLSELKISVPRIWKNDATGKSNFIIHDPDGNMIQFFD